MTSAKDRELAFMDLIVLQRIGPDTTVERFGSKINSSFFEAANILGTLNLKGYVTIEAAMGASKVDVSDDGKKVLALAEEKSVGEIDALDKGILGAISKGIKDPEKLGERLNVRSGDLAYHLYKLVKSNHIDYDLRSGKVNVMLTESGFKDADRGSGEEEPGTEDLAEEITKEEEPKPEKKEVNVGAERTKSKMMYYMKKWGKLGILGLIIVVILLIVLIYFYLMGGK